MKNLFLVTVLAILSLNFVYNFSNAQTATSGKVVLFDLTHGMPEGPGNMIAQVYKGFVEKTPGAQLQVNKQEITAELLKNAYALIVLSPSFEANVPGMMEPEFTALEKTAIVDFVKNGGKILVMAEEERRMPLEKYGINDIVKPFGMEFGDTTAVRINCGAVGLKGEVCKERREIPYAGGRIINGGWPISIVNDEGAWVHMAYVALPNGGKVIAAGEAMSLLLLGSPQGVRLADPFSGGEFNSANFMSRFWGKDSRIFMEEVVTWLLK